MIAIRSIANHPRASYTQQNLIDRHQLSPPLNSICVEAATSGRTPHSLFTHLTITVYLLLIFVDFVCSFYLCIMCVCACVCMREWKCACLVLSVCVRFLICVRVCVCFYCVCLCFHAGHSVSVLFTHRTVFVCLFVSQWLIIVVCVFFGSFRIDSFLYLIVCVCFLFVEGKIFFTFHRRYKVVSCGFYFVNFMMCVN